MAGREAPHEGDRRQDGESAAPRKAGSGRVGGRARVRLGPGRAQGLGADPKPEPEQGASSSCLVLYLCGVSDHHTHTLVSAPDESSL